MRAAFEMIESRMLFRFFSGERGVYSPCHSGNCVTELHISAKENAKNEGKT